MSSKPIRVGILGIGRGHAFIRSAVSEVGMELVALCDTWEEKLRELCGRHGVAPYTDFDRFLEHDMDAVILANYFHEHAPFAIRALDAGMHVMSETSCNATLAEGVALCRAVERSGKIYMLAENYPYSLANQELRRLYRAGEIGQVLYAEGEYNHPMREAERLRMAPSADHWRACIPSTYYCTHGLAPLVCITGEMPVRVNGLSIPGVDYDGLKLYRGDPGSVILGATASGAVFRVMGLQMPGHSVAYRLHGQGGAMETVRDGGYMARQVRVWHEAWNRNPDQPLERVYQPDWAEHGELVERLGAGHGGGDFWVNLHFAEAIRTGEPPFLDVYRGVGMSSVGILAWRSALQGGAPQDVPDFRDEAARAAYEDDHASPFPSHRDPQRNPDPPPCSVGGERRFSEADHRFAETVWSEAGLTAG